MLPATPGVEDGGGLGGDEEDGGVRVAGEVGVAEAWAAGFLRGGCDMTISNG